MNDYCFVLLVEINESLINFYIPMCEVCEDDMDKMIKDPSEFQNGFILLEGDIKKNYYPCSLLPYFDEPLVMYPVWHEGDRTYNMVGDKKIYSNTLIFL